MTVEEVLIMERCLLNEARYEYLIWASETVAEEITKAHATVQQAKKARKSGGRWYNGYGLFP